MPRVTLAYSIKTNPLPELLELARASGMWAEAITQHEAAHALGLGFAPGSIVLNGPAKGWPEKRVDGCAAVFCDSLEELAALRRAVGRRAERVDCFGVRLRPATVRSRFGIDLSVPGAFAAVVRELKRLPRGQPIGFHFHQASSAIGVATWRYLARNFVAAARILGEHAGRRPALISLGGGWHPDDWDVFLRDELGGLVRYCRRELPGLRRLILEPGKALAQRSMCLAMRVLEVRRGEAVVDGSVAELPDLASHPHRFVSRHTKDFRPWGHGSARLLGRLCMEFDVVGHDLRLPRALKAGDLLAVLDAGAYDASMAYVFGRGLSPQLAAPGTL